MRQRSSLTHRVYLLALAVATLLSLLLRTLSLFRNLDEIGYFTATALPVLTNVLLAIATVGCVIYPLLLIKKDTLPANASISFAGRIISVLAALMLAVAAILLLTTLQESAQAALTVVATLALLCGVAYFLLRAKGLCGGLSLLAFGIILGAILLISVTYFDLFTPMNSPRKTSLHLCLLAVALYLLYEMRLAVARPFPRALLAVASLCFLLTVSVSGSNLIWSLANDVDTVYLAGDLACLAAGLCAALRVTELLFPALSLSPAAAPNEAACEEGDR